MSHDTKRNLRTAALIAAVLCILALALLIIRSCGKTEEPEPVPVAPPVTAPAVVPEPEPEFESETEQELKYGVGLFGPDEERLEYVSGEMTLRVPRMEYDGPVYSGEADVDRESETFRSVSGTVLDQGPGLFGASQMPSESNSNVSIAAHRDIIGMEFYDIDKMTYGDYIYLTYKNREYAYLYQETFVTHDNDWEPIRTKDYSCVTLQSCTPVNVASHRIFVVGKLAEVKDIE